MPPRKPVRFDRYFHHHIAKSSWEKFMKVVRLAAPGGLESLRLIEEDQPEPKAGEMLVRIRANSLNAHDDMVLLGRLPTVDGRIPLSDGAGEVIFVADDVDEFQPGDAVVSTFWPYWLAGEMTASTRRDIPGDSVDGYAREYVCMPAHAFTRSPDGYTHVEAATLPCAALTAWSGLVRRGQVKPGDTVLILGTGSVSLFALQFAKATGARVIATSSSAEKLQKLKDLGADIAINYHNVPEWGQQVLDATDGRGVDHVIEVGGPGTLPQSITACRIGGHIALIGVLTGFAGEVPTAAILSKLIRLSGIQIGSRADQKDMIRAITANRLKPIVDRIFPLHEISDAFKYYETQKNFGKVCIEL